MAGDRRALARAITLVESTRADDQERAQRLLAAILPASGKAIRLGITGTPGVGKSTFIEAFGTFLTGRGLKVAVLAVDPSSARTGGSILGDKTRMEELARDPNAFIRPSPSGGTLGGVARRTREAMICVEAAGFDVVLVETVGVGQSETAVAEMVDMFLLLLAPGGGDDLQGIKRGIMELADLIIVNKADGDLLKPANIARSDYQHAVHMIRPRSPLWFPEVLLASALQKSGLGEIWSAVEKFRTKLGEAGEINRRRAEQAKGWMWRELGDRLIQKIHENQSVAGKLPELEAAVAAGRMTPAAAVDELLRIFSL